MRQLLDPLRNLWVKATPEEVVRQTWIARMIGELKFPKELIAVEKELRSLPNVAAHVPDRRIDILSYMKTKEGLKPLLLLECKEMDLSEEALSQVMSYNFYIKAPYVAIANLHQIRLKRDGRELTRLPSYRELIEVLHG